MTTYTLILQRRIKGKLVGYDTGIKLLRDAWEPRTELANADEQGKVLEALLKQAHWVPTKRQGGYS